MRKVLHIRTRPDDTLAEEILALQRGDAQLEVQVADLTGEASDYNDLLLAIFAADSVEVW